MDISIILSIIVGLCGRAIHGSLEVVQTLDFKTNSSYTTPDVEEYFTSLLYWRTDDTYIVTGDARYQLLYNSIQITDGNGPHCLTKSHSGRTYKECYWLGTERYSRVDAVAACVRDLGHLASFHDNTTLMWLGEKFPQLRGPTPYWVRTWFTSDGRYIPGNLDPVTSWAPWAAGEPLNTFTKRRVEMRGLQYYIQYGEAGNPYICFNTTQLFCGLEPVFSFANVTQSISGNMRLGDYVTYECKKPTETIGGKPGVNTVTLTCDVDPNDITKALLSPGTFTCEDPNCGLPPEFRGTEPVAGSVLLNKVLVGNSISYRCRPGYNYTAPTRARLPNPSATCGPDGEWTNTTYLCKAQYSCLKPLPLPGATHTYDTLELYGVVIYTCKQPGQVFKYGRTQQLNTTCSTSSQSSPTTATAGWDSLSDECEDVQCGAPPSVIGASISSAYPGPYGSSRNYNCPTGKRFPSGGTTWTITCSDKGEWTPAPPAQCEEVRCGTPPRVWHSVYPLDDVMGRDVTFGQNVYYQCQPNYAFINDVTAKVNKTLTCDLGGWSERHPGTCEKISCGKPVLSKDHTLFYSMSSLGAKAVYTCAFDGYAFAGGRQIWESECKLEANSASEGTWTDVPYNCNPVDCHPEGPLPHLGSSLEISTSRRMGAHATYNCHGNGYFTNGGHSRTVTCDGTGSWGTIPKGLGCQERQCPSPPDVTGADIVSTNGKTAGSVTRYQCKPGTRYSTGLPHFSLTCLPSGYWMTPGDGCKASQCPPIPMVGNADVSSTRQGAVQLVTAMCHRGHRFPEGTKKKNFNCTSTQGWTLGDTDYRCYRQTCSPIQLPNGNLNDTSIFYDTVTEIDCNAGFRFQDGGSRRSLLCDAPGLWHGSYSLCTAVYCNTVPVVPYASVVSGGRGGAKGYNHTVTYKCTQGMRFEDGLTQTSICCLAQDTWDRTLSCAARCPAPPVVGDSEITSFSVDPGNVTTYRCRRGYRVSDNQSEANITCDTTTLTWTNTIPVCKSTYCKALNDLSHTHTNTSQTVFDTAVSLRCEQGYIFTHLPAAPSGLTAMTSTCGADGEWDPLIKPCQLAVCTELPDVPYGIVHGIYGVYGDVISVTCLPSYWVSRDVMGVNITCGADGNWQGAPTTCKPITCPPLGIWEFYQTNTSSMSPGTLVNVTCMDQSSASTAVGWQVVLCGELGVWLDPVSGIPDLINCAEAYTAVVFEPVDAPASTPIGLVWILMALVPILLIIVGDILTISSHRKIGSTNAKKSTRKQQHGKIVRAIDITNDSGSNVSSLI